MSARLLRGVRIVDLRPGVEASAPDPVDVLVRDGVVAAVGAAATAGVGGTAEATEVVDLDGRWLLPGLWDEHVHSVQWALVRRRVDLTSARSAREAAELVAAHLRHTPARAGETVVGYGFRDALWTEPPTATLLDAAAPGVPVALRSHDMHTIWLSTAALGIHGVPDRPAGILVEEEASAVLSRLDEAPAEALDAWVADGVREVVTRGVVGVRDLERPWPLHDWVRRVRAGQRSLRVDCAVYPEALEEVAAAGLRTGDVVPDTGGLVTMGSLKLLTDGSLNTRTARCHEPYPGSSGRGLLVIPGPDLAALLTRGRQLGLEAAVHAIGDEAATVVLDAVEATGVRARMEHAQLVAARDLPRFAALGVVASVQPQHALDDRDVADRHWSDRTDRAFAYRDLHDAGAELVLGSDAPVAPLDPWVTLAAAVSRTDDHRAPWHPEQELPRGVALRASTGGRQVVAAGMPADLVAVDVDPWEADARTLRAMPVAATMLSGTFTHLDPAGPTTSDGR